jgi:hypothetical protein
MMESPMRSGRGGLDIFSDEGHNRSCKYDASYEGSLDLNPLQINHFEIPSNQEGIAKSGDKTSKFKIALVFFILAILAGASECLLSQNQNQIQPQVSK